MSIFIDNKKNYVYLCHKILIQTSFLKFNLKSWRLNATKTMKKASILLIVLFFGIALNGFSQTAPAPTDFYAGKWEITIIGTPNGDSKMITTINRKDGKLVGEMTNPAEPTTPANPLTSVEEVDGKMTIYFSTSGYDLAIPFEKVDNDNLKGKLMDMFDVTAKRVK